MSAIRIAGRYAKSLIDLSQERGELDAIYNDMMLFAETAKLPDFAAMLKSPIISADKKEKIFDAIFGATVSPVALTFFKLLITKGRESYLPEVAKEVIFQYKNLKSISSVKLITATPVSAVTIAGIKARLEADNVLHNSVDLEASVDADLIGGFVLEFDNKRYDSSIAYQLDQIRKGFSQKNVYTADY